MHFLLSGIPRFRRRSLAEIHESVYVVVFVELRRQSQLRVAATYHLALEVLSVFRRMVLNMTKKLIFPLFLYAMVFAIGLSTAAPAPQQEQPKKDSKSTAASMTGCVDEQDGRYVLTNDRELAVIAILEADGFPTEAFAKHMGHKVTIRGTVIPGGDQPTFKVRSVVAVSDVCAPAQ